VLSGHIYDDWHKREDSIVGQILRLMPDVIALQEVQIRGVKQDPTSPSFGRRKHHADRLLDLLKGHGFEGTYQHHVRAKNTVMLLWRSETFKEAAPPTTNFSTPSCKGRELIINLNHIPSGQKVFVATSHARVPLDQGALRQDWPLEDVTVVTKELQSLLASEEKSPRRFGEAAKGPAVIFMGDFNSDASSDAYRYLSGSDTGLSLQSAYSAVLGSEPVATNINPTDDFADCIDYIFFGRRSLKAVAVLEPFDQRCAAIRCTRLGGNVGTPRSSAAAVANAVDVIAGAGAGAGAGGAANGPGEHSLARYGMQGCSFPNRMNPSDHMPLLAMLEFGDYSEACAVLAVPAVPASAAKVKTRLQPSMQPSMALPHQVLTRVARASTGKADASPGESSGDVSLGVLGRLGPKADSSSSSRRSTPSRSSSISSINSILTGGASGRKKSPPKVSFERPSFESVLPSGGAANGKGPGKLARTVRGHSSVHSSLHYEAYIVLSCSSLLPIPPPPPPFIFLPLSPPPLSLLLPPSSLPPSSLLPPVLHRVPRGPTIIANCQNPPTEVL
jgi:mRNA deadenylase 3'-5' endonuclease subunit Ccr4